MAASNHTHRKFTGPKTYKSYVSKRPIVLASPQDGGTFLQVARVRFKDYWRRGDLWKALETGTLFATGLATGVALTPGSPRVRENAALVAAVGAPMTAAFNRLYARRRLAFRKLPSNAENWIRVVKMRDTEWLRNLDHALVDRYAIDPKGTERHLGVTPVGAAYYFGSMRAIRKAPSTLVPNLNGNSYLISKHEGKTFSGIVRPLLQYKVSQLPLNIEKQAILDHHFPNEGLKPIEKVERLPPEISGKTLRRLLEEPPQTPEEAVSMALLAGAVARRNILIEQQYLGHRKH